MITFWDILFEKRIFLFDPWISCINLPKFRFEISQICLLSIGFFAPPIESVDIRIVKSFFIYCLFLFYFSSSLIPYRSSFLFELLLFISLFISLTFKERKQSLLTFLHHALLKLTSQSCRVIPNKHFGKRNTLFREGSDLLPNFFA